MSTVNSIPNALNDLVLSGLVCTSANSESSYKAFVFPKPCGNLISPIQFTNPGLPFSSKRTNPNL